MPNMITHSIQQCTPQAARLPSIVRVHRRQLLLATSIALVPPARATDYQVYTGQQFNFAYPSDFVLAFDRDKGLYGNLVAVANYNKYQTFVVERLKPPPGAAGSNTRNNHNTTHTSSQTRLRLVMRARSLPPNLMRYGRCTGMCRPQHCVSYQALDYDLLDVSLRVANTRSYVDVDYVLEACQGGEIQEGRGGVRRCLDSGSGNLVRTTRRRHLATCTLARGDLYVATASASEALFDEAVFSTIVRSFVV